MTEENPSADIIQGPWKKGRKVVLPDQEEVWKTQEDLAFADDLTEQTMVQFIHTMSENGFNINGESFIQNMAFVIECVKATIYKEMDLEHPLVTLMGTISKVSLSEDNVLEGSIDPEIVTEINEIMLDEPDPEIS